MCASRVIERFDFERETNSFFDVHAFWALVDAGFNCADDFWAEDGCSGRSKEGRIEGWSQSRWCCQRWR